MGHVANIYQLGGSECSARWWLARRALSCRAAPVRPEPVNVSHSPLSQKGKTMTLIAPLILSPSEITTLNDWLAECIWLAPDDYLADMMTLRNHVEHYQSTPVPLTFTMASLLNAYLESLWDRPGATDDLPDIESIQDKLQEGWLENEVFPETFR
jgi:hypothetical protein